MKKEFDTSKTNNIHPINANNQETLLLPTIAIVFEAQQGEAITIYNEVNNTHYEVSGHLYSVPKLKQGDKVLVINTQQGIIVTGRLRKENEKPTIAFTLNNDGSLNIDSDKNITFNTLNAKIEIKEGGHITISGKKIDSISSGTNQLKGERIDLNC